MSNILGGITLFVSIDNKLFAFDTQCIVQSPLNAFIPYYIGFTTVNEVKVIKLSLFASVMQAYILLATGRPMFPLSNHCTMNDNQNVHNINNVSGNLEMINHNIPDNDDDDEISKFIDDDEIFKDFDEFQKQSMFDYRNM